MPQGAMGQEIGKDLSSRGQTTPSQAPADDQDQPALRLAAADGWNFQLSLCFTGLT